ncbi:MAG: hypothetical protein ACFFCS_29070 [Candidatus Hodarchaeota archaeon]
MVSSKSSSKKEKKTSNDSQDGGKITCSNCHRVISKGEAFSKNYITNEIHCEDCEEEIVLAEGNLLSIN